MEPRLVLCTNIPSHHQIPLGQAFADLLNADFNLVCWEPVPEERARLGWGDRFNEEWLIQAWLSADESARALEILQSADVVVWGAAPISEIKKRVASGKLTFRYTERLFKKGQWRLFDPRVFKAIREMYKSTNRSNHHLLSVGPYCAEDFRLIRMFQDRMWRWGYFPALPTDRGSKESHSEPVVLWAGRMLAWKRVGLLLAAAARARQQGCGRFRLQLIGCGPEEDRLRSSAVQLGLSDICEFRGSQSPEEVGLAMEKADIYVFPSNQQEGWGVVVNEAMSRGCCVIGSKSPGAVPWLIRDGVNGYVFDGNSAEDLGQILYRCIENPARMSEMGIAARATISDLWSPSVSADRFLKLCDTLENGKSPPFQDEGPCSPV